MSLARGSRCCPALAAVDQQITAWMDTNVVILINNFATLAPLRSDLDWQATATIINVMLLQLSQQPLLQSDSIVDAAAKMIYHALFVERD